MKRNLNLMLVTLLTALLALVSLGSAQDQQAEQVTIGVSIPAATHGWTGAVNYWAEQSAERLMEQYPNLEIIVVSAGDAGEQANDLQDLVAINQIDALVVLPFESDPLTAPVANIAEQGIFVTVVDRGLAQEGIEDLYVAGDNCAFGRVAGEYFAERLDGQDANIVILRGIPTVIDNQRVDCFMEAIADTDINVLASEYANWNRDDAFLVMQDFLARFQDIDAIWAQDDDALLGVIAALEQAGRTDELWAVGGAGMAQVIKMVMEGSDLVPVDVLYPPSMIATAMNVTALNYVSDSPILGEYILTTPLITPENAEQYYFPDSPY